MDLMAVFVVDTAEEELGECFFTPTHTIGKVLEEFLFLSKQKKVVGRCSNDS